MSFTEGLYEQVISKLLQQEIEAAKSYGKIPQIRTIDQAEAKHIISSYLTSIIEASLGKITGTDKKNALDEQIGIANKIIQLLSDIPANDDVNNLEISDSAEELLSISPKIKEIPRPETSISISTLFTGSKLEPSMMSELKREILSSDRIDLIVSFIKWSGLRLIYEELKEFTKTHPLRIITTTYMGATDEKTLTKLLELPNTEIKISYETSTTRLHAKSYVFYRDTGFSTAYVGSSNISSAALGTGLEWNVKLTERDMSHIIKIISATFETYWNSPDFETFTEEKISDLRKALKKERYVGEDVEYNFQIEPFPFQREVLEKLNVERVLHNRWKNLVVAATGTGKTVISGFDYKRLKSENKNSSPRLLFVAHRTDILKQSLECFRGILRDQNFGELYDGNHKPDEYDHLFMTIQTFESQKFYEEVKPDFYDMVIVDEFHHAASKSYQKLLTYFTPKILLGLTATPERMDGLDITEYFGGVIAAEIRLPEAIDRCLLSPFQYFCITDPVDLSEVKFEYGKYDVADLERQYLGNKRRSETIIDSVRAYVTDVSEIIGLGFCVSIKHAEEMADQFNKAGIPSTYLDGSSSEEERKSAKRKLQNKEIHFIFTVNLYNEGVDIPEVNTILFLRPTESLTVFLQQLGRGLRLSEGKEVLTVLDFVGQANKKYNFERKFRSLLGKTHRPIDIELKNGFPTLPKGCFIQMEKVAMGYILENIRSAVPDKRNTLLRLKTYLNDTGKVPTLRNFISTYELSLSDVYRSGLFCDLCAQAGISKPINCVDANKLAKGFRRLCHIDSKRWITVLLKVFKDGNLPETEEERQMITMLYYTLYPTSTPPSALGYEDQKVFIEYLCSMPQVVSELIEMLEICYEQTEHLTLPVNLGYPSSLDLYGSYSRDEIEAGLGEMTWDYHPSIREGVHHIKEKNTVVMFVTLQKSEKEYSPTTLYDDYVISENLFHWQSQNKTSSESSVGLSYINQETNGLQMLLFVRKDKGTNGETTAYQFLGRVNYMSHQGSKPMNIVWKLENKLPMSTYMDLSNMG